MVALRIGCTRTRAAGQKCNHTVAFSTRVTHISRAVFAAYSRYNVMRVCARKIFRSASRGGAPLRQSTPFASSYLFCKVARNDIVSSILRRYSIELSRTAVALIKVLRFQGTFWHKRNLVNRYPPVHLATRPENFIERGGVRSMRQRTAEKPCGTDLLY